MNSESLLSSSLAYVMVGVIIFSMTFLGAYLKVMPVPEVSLEWRGVGEDQYQYIPTYNNRSGKKLALIYIGSSTCGASNHEDLPGIVKKLKMELKEKATDKGWMFTATGVAIDWSVSDGVDHLKKFGQFDQVISGRNWRNEGAVKYLWEDLPGEAATPQVLAVKRNVESNGKDFYTHDEKLITRKIGVYEISQWIENGAPVPTLEPIAKEN